MHMPAHNLARVGICNQTQINKFVIRGQLRDVCHPHLLTRAGAHLLLARLE